jgi:hypothetical protein
VSVESSPAEESSGREERKIQAIEVSRKLWRLECHRHPWLPSQPQSSSTALDWMVAQSKSALVPARSLSSWLHMIRQGGCPHRQYADHEGEMLYNGVAEIAGEQRAKESVQEMLLYSRDFLVSPPVVCSHIVWMMVVM